MFLRRIDTAVQPIKSLYLDPTCLITLVKLKYLYGLLHRRALCRILIGARVLLSPEVF